MLSIFIYQLKYSNQSHRVCLQLIEYAIANVGKYLQIVVLQAVQNRQNKTLSVNVKILITRFEGKCKYFSSIKLDSYRKLTLSRKVLTNHHFRKPQGNTALDFVIVLYMLVEHHNLNFFFNVDFSKRQEMKVR